MNNVNMTDENSTAPAHATDAGENQALTLTDPHYLAHLTHSGESRDVRATADINTSSGLKLIARGTKITPRHFERLVGHRLSHQIDHLVSVADAITADALATSAKHLVTEEPFSRLIGNEDTRKRAIEALSQVQCLPVMAGKLAIIKERLPAQFDHLVRVALCAATIAENLRFTGQDCIRAATAGAFHDVGNLHIDPAIFGGPGKLTAEQRRQVYAHPLIGNLILSQFSLYDPHVSRAVLEHHERLDGSGYPKGLLAARQSPLGKALAVAEVTVSVLERDPELDIRVFLRSHAGILDREALATLIDEAKPFQPMREHDSRIEPSVVARRIEVINEAISNWETAPQRPDSHSERFVARRLGRISRNLTRAGLGPGAPLERVPEMAEDPELLTEVNVVSREALFQLQSTIQELKQRWPDYEELGSAPDDAPTAWLRAAARLFEKL